jgi:hypothetical protein
MRTQKWTTSEDDYILKQGPVLKPVGFKHQNVLITILGQVGSWAGGQAGRKNYVVQF